MGRFIQDDPIYARFVQKFSLEYKFPPHAFICASSGEGKSTFPFGLNIPFLYINLPCRYSNSAHSNLLTDQSNYLNDLIEKDLKRRFEASRNGKTITRFFSLGFLAELIKTVQKAHSESQHPVEAQALIPRVEFSTMSISKFIEQFGGSLKFFPIFLENFEMKSNNYYGRNWNVGSFLWKLIRDIGCTPVRINSDASFLCERSLSQYSINSDKNGLWALLLFKMPKIPDRWIEYIKMRAEKRLELWRAERNRHFPSKELIHFIYDYLKDDRPAFIQSAHEIIEELTEIDIVPENKAASSFCSKHMNDIDSDETALSLILGYILSRFQIKNFNLFTWSQLAYIAQFAWNHKSFKQKSRKRYNSDDDRVNRSWGVRRLFTDCDFAYEHMARLSILSDADFPEAASLCINGSTIKYLEHTRGDLVKAYGDEDSFEIGNKGKLPDKKVSFETDLRFEKFSDSPMAGLISTGIKIKDARVMISDQEEVGLYRDSILSSMSSVLGSKNDNVRNIRHASPEMYMQIALICGMVYSSHVNGFRGCTLYDFIAHLWKELDFHAKFYAIDEVQMPQDFPQNLASLKIPYCSPTAGDDWKEDFVRDLKKALPDVADDMHLGKVFPFIGIDRRADLFMTCPSSRRNLIVAKCRFFDKKIAPGCLDELLCGFDKYKASIYIALCMTRSNQPDPLRNFTEEEEERAQNSTREPPKIWKPKNQYCLWMLRYVKEETEDSDEGSDGEELPKISRRKRIIEKFDDNQDVKAGRHVLVFELSNLYSGNQRHFEEYKEDLI